MPFAQQLVDQAIVEVEALGVRRARSFRKHPRPCDRKPVGLDAEFLIRPTSSL